MYLKQFTLFKTELNVKCALWSTDRKKRAKDENDRRSQQNI